MCGYTSYRDGRLTPPDINDGDEPQVEAFPLTARLREMLETIGIEYTEGGVLNDGTMCDTEDTTTIWLAHGEPSEGIEVEEGERGLYVTSPVSPSEVMAVVMACACGRRGWDA